MPVNGGIAISSAHPLQNVNMLLHELRIVGEGLQHGGVHRNKRCIEVGKIDSQYPPHPSPDPGCPGGEEMRSLWKKE